MDTQWLFGWWNLIFIVPFLLAVLYLGLYAVSGISFGDADADNDFGADHDLSADHDLGAEHDVSADHDASGDASDGDASDQDHDLDSDQGDQVPAHVAVMSWLGVGRVPLSLILMVLLLSWGALGFVVNQLARAQFHDNWRMALLSLPVAAVGSLAVTRILTSLMVRFVPLYETNARRRHELLGCVGETLFTVNDKFGLVSVRDEGGELHQVPCHAGANATGIPKGARVQLIAYNARQDSFEVRPEPNN